MDCANWDQLWLDVNIATLNDEVGYGAITDGAVAVSGDKIAWVGARQEVPADATQKVKHIFNAKGFWLTPGLIDCHTHMIYAGNRVAEFKQRLQGQSYEEIAHQGGGIQSTVNATRATKSHTLNEEAKNRLLNYLKQGVTTVEIKSGYGLDLKTECRQLHCARQLNAELPMDIINTYLGAHVLPDEYKDKPEAYINFICTEVLPKLKADNLADRVDGFCDTLGFAPEHLEPLFNQAREMGFDLCLHADQFADVGAAEFAAKHKALSADHLEFTSEQGLRAMMGAGTVAVLLPSAYYFLQQNQKPPIEKFREYNIPIALASDHNPGSSPMFSLLSTMNLACVLWNVLPEEALLAVTQNAAKALGVWQQKGSIAVGKQADFALWDINDPDELSYHLGHNSCRAVVKDGKLAHQLGDFVKMQRAG